MSAEEITEITDKKRPTRRSELVIFVGHRAPTWCLAEQFLTSPRAEPFAASREPAFWARLDERATTLRHASASGSVGAHVIDLVAARKDLSSGVPFGDNPAAAPGCHQPLDAVPALANHRNAQMTYTSPRLMEEKPFARRRTDVAGARVLGLAGEVKVRQKPIAVKAR